MPLQALERGDVLSENSLFPTGGCNAIARTVIANTDGKLFTLTYDSLLTGLSEEDPGLAMKVRAGSWSCDRGGSGQKRHMLKQDVLVTTLWDDGG